MQGEWADCVDLETNTMKVKKFVEIEKGVFRDPDQKVIRASDGRWIKYEKRKG